MGTIGNRPDTVSLHRDEALACVTRGDQARHAVYTESVARRLDLPWSEAQAILSDLYRRGDLKFEQVARPYRDPSKRGRTYTTFRWWPRTSRRGTR